MKLIDHRGKLPPIESDLSDIEAARLIVSDREASRFARQIAERELIGWGCSNKQLYWLHKFGLEARERGVTPITITHVQKPVDTKGKIWEEERDQDLFY